LATTAFVLANAGSDSGAVTGVALADAPVKGGVFNGGFEFAPPFVAVQTATGWIDGTAAGSATIDQYGWYASVSSVSGNFQFDSSVTHSGKNSLKISNPGITSSNIVVNTLYFDIAALSKYCSLLKASTKYRFTFWLKTNNTTADGAYVYLLQYDTSAVQGTGISSSKLSGTNDWTCITTEFTSDADAGGSYLKIFLAHNVAGNISDAWFDDITLEEVVEDTTFTGTIPTPVRPTIVGVTTTDNIDQSLAITAGQEATDYAVPLAVNEGATHRQTFTPTRNKVTQIGVNIIVKGGATADWTLIVHDSANVVVASVVKTNANLTAAAMNYFDVPFLWTTGAYHFHLITSAITATPPTVQVNTNDDLEAASFTQRYAKPTENATIVCNGEKISLSTNEDGLLSGAIIDLDKGKYLYTGRTALTQIDKISDVYAASAGGGTIPPHTINGWYTQATRWAYGDGGVSTGVVYITYKVNTLLPIKHLKIIAWLGSNEVVNKEIQISSDNTNWTTINTVNNPEDAIYTLVSETDLMNGLSTFFVRGYKGAVTDTFYFGLVSVEADLDTASVPSLVLQPLATPVQYSENITLPATGASVYYWTAKYANDRGVVVPHLEIKGVSPSPVIWTVPLKVDNSGETNPAIKILNSESTTCTVGSGTDEGGNFILNNGEYVTVTTPATSLKITYQVGKGTTAFTNLTMNRIYLSSNGVANSATKDPSHQFNFYLGMLKEGVQKVVEGVQTSVNNLALAVIPSSLWSMWIPTLVWTTGTPVTGLVTIARYKILGNICFISFNVVSTDSNACTALTITLPVAPKNNGLYYSLSAIERYGAAGATYANPLAYITDSGTTIAFRAFATATDAQAIEVTVSGWYEI
jgi:hypothetical protein